MSFDVVNILAVFSAIASAVICYKMMKDYVALRTQHTGRINRPVIEDAEYEGILRATYWLENERQKNQGEHFDDESVYLNRAQTIRRSTSFFSLVNK